METAAIIAGIITAVASLWRILAEKDQADKNLVAQKELQEDSQDFTHQENIASSELQQQYHEFNLFNDPILQKKGLVAAGMSEAGAVQALVGGVSTGYSPTGMTSSSSTASVPQFPNISGFEGIGDALNSIFENERKVKEGRKIESDIEVNEQYMKESDARIVKQGHDMDMDRAQLELTRQLNASIVGKNEAERDLNIKRLDEINQSIQESLARIKNLDAQTINEYLRGSMLIAQTENIQADTALKGAEMAKVQTETTGQIIANYDSDIELQFKKARIEASKILGCDVDAPLVTQYLELVAFGRYDSVNTLLDGSRVGQSGNIGFLERLSVGMSNDSRRPFFKDFKVDKSNSRYLFSPSMQPYWNPN